MIQLPSEEKIIVFTRRHPITLILKMAAIATLLLISIAVIIALTQSFSLFDSLTLLLALIVLLILFYAIFAFIYFINWHLDVWIITDKRVIDIEQISLFNSEFSEFMLAKIQDVSVDKKGFLANIFDYGDVHIQTAGMARVFIFKQVPNPLHIKNCLMKSIEGIKIKNISL